MGEKRFIRNVSPLAENAVDLLRKRMLLGVTGLMLGGAIALGAPNLAYADEVQQPQESGVQEQIMEGSQEGGSSGEEFAASGQGQSGSDELNGSKDGDLLSVGQIPGNVDEREAADSLPKADDSATADNDESTKPPDSLAYLSQSLTGYNPSTDYSNASCDVFPKVFSLRTEGEVGAVSSSGGVNVVTPVKLQNPYGTCWAFSSVAASESSVLSEVYAKWDLFAPELKRLYGIDSFQEFAQYIDFSERHLAWFAKTHLPFDSDDSRAASQAGEGLWLAYESDNPNEVFDFGGAGWDTPFIFSSGVGLWWESSVPYMSDEAANGDLDAFNGFNYESSYVDEYGQTQYYTWSVSETMRFLSAMQMENAFQMSKRVINSSAEDYEQRIEAIKRQLLQGRAVVIGYDAENKWMNTSDNAWAYYCPKGSPNHCVTVVGYNDDFPVELFGDAKPLAPGAWLVKNSWGSDVSSFGNVGDWGIDEDGNGFGDGYFWLSYYDASLDEAESFDFKVEDLISTRPSCIIDQHDYMVANLGWNETKKSSSVSKMANVFVASVAQNIREIGVLVDIPNASFAYEIYLLSDSSAKPEDGILLSSGKSDLFAQPGFYSVSLGHPCIVDEGSLYSVIVTLKDIAGNYCMTYKNNYSAQSGSAETTGLYYEAVVNPGESFEFRAEDGWVDLYDCLYDLGERYGRYLTFDNFSIKVYSDCVSSDAVSMMLTPKDDESIVGVALNRFEAQGIAQETLSHVLSEIQAGYTSNNAPSVRQGVISAEAFEALFHAEIDPFNDPRFAVSTSIKSLEGVSGQLESMAEQAGKKVAFDFSILSDIYRIQMPGSAVGLPESDNCKSVGDSYLGQLLRFDSPVSFCLAIPDSLMMRGREFFVFGPMGRIAAAFIDGMLVFSTDIATGDFVLAYADAPVPCSDPDSDPARPLGDQIRYEAQTPATGDANGATVALTAAMLSAGIAALASRKGMRS